MHEEHLIIRAAPELSGLIPEFLEYMKQYVQTVPEALDRSDFETIRMVGHRMKGEGGCYGFDAITNLGGCLEQAAKDRAPEEIKRLSGELSFYLEHVQVVYE